MADDGRARFARILFLILREDAAAEARITVPSLLSQ